MADRLAEPRATADAHLRRDVEAQGKWTCACEACRQVRSLIGMNKALEIRPLVRKIEEIEQQLPDLPSGPAKQTLQEQCFALYDRLAEVMAE